MAMAMGTSDDAAMFERLSALVDGELDGAGVESACRAWRADSELRRNWHAWHAIGDVLRSDDLACDPDADLAFCAAVSARLAREAVVLAPARVVAGAAATRQSSLRSRWAVGSAVAAGVVLVAGTFAVLGPGLAPPAERVASADTSAASSPDSAAVQAVPVLASRVAGSDIAAPEVAVVGDQKVIRDARLDRYLVAHKQFAGSSALGVPSAFLRSATVDSTSR
jgi:sigma-E factor negative regulatory protein RseA